MAIQLTRFTHASPFLAGLLAVSLVLVGSTTASVALAQDVEVLPPAEFDPLLPAQTSALPDPQTDTQTDTQTDRETDTSAPTSETDREDNSDADTEAEPETSGETASDSASEADTGTTGEDATSDTESSDESTIDAPASDLPESDSADNGDQQRTDETTVVDTATPTTGDTTSSDTTTQETSSDVTTVEAPATDEAAETNPSSDAQTDGESAVENTNLNPELARLTNHTIQVGESLEFVVSARSQSDDVPGIFASQLPPNATLTDNLDGTRLFSIDATEQNIGANVITFVAFEENDPSRIDEATITITVQAAAQPEAEAPADNTADNTGLTIEPIPAQTANVGQMISVRVVPSEPNGPVPSLFSLNLPAGATLDDNLDGTRTFNWKPMDGDSGVYMIDFVAVNPDDNDRRTSESFVLTVLSNTMPLIEIPQIEPLNDHQVQVNTMMILRVTPIGVDGAVPDLNVSPLPVNATFDDNGDGTRTLRWRPVSGAEGTYTLTFVATDPNNSDLVGRRSIEVEVISDGSIPTTDEITQPVPQPDVQANASVDGDDNNEDQAATSGDDNNSAGETSVDDTAIDEPTNTPVDTAPPTEPPATMTRETFLAALPGSRLDECRITVPGVESERTVETFTDELYILDFYFYRNVDCSGIPYGSSNPLLIYGYTVGESVITDDGRQAFPIDLQVEQTGQIGGEEFGEPEGTRAFDIIAIEGDSVLFAEAIASTTPETRPTLLQAALPSENRPRLGKPDIAPSDLVGSWQSNCLNSQTVLYEFSEEQLRQNSITWDSATCDGSIHHNLETLYTIAYGEQSRSLFGDYMLPVDITIASSSYLQLDDTAGAPAAPPLPPIGMESFQIVTLEQDTLMFGTCSFIGGCLETAATRPDMVHLNNGRRWQRAP